MEEVIPSAVVLQKSANQQRQLRDFILEILKGFRDELQTARQSGQFELKTTMPIQFDVANMRNQDCQRIVWSNCIKILKDKGYRVKIHPQKKQCVIQIRWISKEDEQEVSSQMALLAEHMDKTL